MKNSLTEKKNTFPEINSRVDKAEDQIKDLEDQGAENTQSKQQKEKRNQKMRVALASWLEHHPDKPRLWV